MANPREARGWSVTILGGSIAYAAFAVRMWTVFAPPAWPVPAHETLLVIALLGVAVAAAGLREALWYLLVAADGIPMYAASVLLVAAGALHLFQIPGQTNSSFMVFLFVAALLEWVSLPLLTYRRLPALVAVAVLVLALALLGSGFAFLPLPFAAAVDAWGWIGLVARLLELAALGAVGNMLFIVREVPPASERTGRPA